MADIRQTESAFGRSKADRASLPLKYGRPDLNPKSKPNLKPKPKPDPILKPEPDPILKLEPDPSP